MFWKVEYFIRDFVKDKGGFSRILDVGSRNINGQVRHFVGNPEEFVGIDMVEGEGVDIVMNGHDLAQKWTEPYFDLVTCCETFEHDKQFWLTLEAMKKVLKPGGYMLITVPGYNFPQHDYPSDYYRFIPPTLRDVFFEGYDDFHWEEYADQKGVVSLLAYGRKPIWNEDLSNKQKDQ